MPKANATILLVEDEPSLATMYTRALAKIARVCEVGRTYEDALQIAREIHPDVFVVDLILPEAPKRPVDFHRRMGFEFVAEIRLDKAFQSTPVLILTNLDSAEDRKTAHKMGAVDYLIKSNTLPRMLVERVEMLLPKS